MIMKRYSIYILVISCMLMFGITSIHSQQVNTLYFLENAPMRHLINPAFQPVSNVYVTLPVIGYSSAWVGNNAFTMKDFIFTDKNGNTITPYHPNANPDWLAKKPKNTLIDADAYINLFGLGVRIKDNGYFHLNISEHIIAGAATGTNIFGINQLDSGLIGPFNLGANALVYTDFALGYSHKINDQWTVGGKFKFLVGQAYVNANLDNISLAHSMEELHAYGNGNIVAAAPLQWQNLPTDVTDLGNIDTEALTGTDYRDWITPAGLGAAFDLGATYKPHEQVQISASVTDLGFIRWTNLAKGNLSIDTTFTGVELNYGDYVYEGELNQDSLTAHLTNTLNGYADALNISDIDNNAKPLTRMLTANLHVGVDANFWDNRVGVGVHSRTRFYNNVVTEELTLGAAFRPFNWVNIAASYSFINGHWSNIGAALSIAPYDGIMLTLATDYIPTTYAKLVTEEDNYSLPYKTPGTNISLGIAIVAGTSRKDSDKDKVSDKFDLCPLTPRNVAVDEQGCPFDEDGDGVFDYMDQCPNTPAEAYDLIDSLGCPLDTDMDGVADYLDQCPNTPAAAFGSIDSLGCPIDTDGDGVPDYLDQCPQTPAEAAGMVDSIGCPLDTDMDGVPDFIDMCPDTPEEARGMIDQFGCPIDSDTDGIYDFCDKCSDTPEEAGNLVDENGCPLDSDGDGIYDYQDLCPTIAGVKENMGCPEVKREVRNLLNKAMAGIQFENGKATIKSSSNKILNDIAKIFIDNPSYFIEVQGHSDNVGKYDFNVDLSERRAQAVRLYLIKKGVPAERMVAHGYGPDKPIADNKTKEGRAKNRRVEFNITFEEVAYETVYDRVPTTK